jgi:hypothetical protein
VVKVDPAGAVAKFSVGKHGFAVAAVAAVDCVFYFGGKVLRPVPGPVR